MPPEDASRNSCSLPISALGAMVLLGLGLRVLSALHMGGTLSGDEGEYHALALGLAERGRYSGQPGFNTLLYSPTPGEPTAFRPPGFPAVLAAIYLLSGRTRRKRGSYLQHSTPSLGLWLR